MGPDTISSPPRIGCAGSWSGVLVPLQGAVPPTVVALPLGTDTSGSAHCSASNTPTPFTRCAGPGSDGMTWQDRQGAVRALNIAATVLTEL